MKTEYELKIVNINSDEFQKKLKALWAAQKTWERLMRRNIYEINPPVEWMWIRLRDDGVQTTLTIKHVKAHTVDGTKELEVVVNDFDVMHSMLAMMWFKLLTYQENKRISWSLYGCDIEIDTRPLLETYAEIEWPDEKNVMNVFEKLWHTIADTTAVKVKQMYEAKGIDLHAMKKLVFEV